MKMYPPVEDDDDVKDIPAFHGMTDEECKEPQEMAKASVKLAQEDRRLSADIVRHKDPDCEAD